MKIIIMLIVMGFGYLYYYEPILLDEIVTEIRKQDHPFKHPEGEEQSEFEEQGSSEEQHVHEKIVGAPKLYRPLKSHKRYTPTRSPKNNKEADLFELIEKCDFESSIVRNKAVKLAGFSSGTFNIGQVCTIYDYCRNNWKYVNDPASGEYLAKASETIHNDLNGDCDDFAVLLYSFIAAIGGEAHVIYAFNDDSGHAFVEVRVGSNNHDRIKKFIKKRYGVNSIKIRKSNGKYWLNLDWFSDHPGGRYYDWNRGSIFDILKGKYSIL